MARERQPAAGEDIDSGYRCCDEVVKQQAEEGGTRALREGGAAEEPEAMPCRMRMGGTPRRP